MDPICEQKYNFLQKYVPFLANLIKALANDNEKQGKLAQMKLLLDLLNNPDNSVKIETLEKCEEVLCRVFGSNEEKVDEDEWVVPLPLIKEEVPEELEDNLTKANECWENHNECDENRRSNSKTSHQNTETFDQQIQNENATKAPVDQDNNSDVSDQSFLFDHEIQKEGKSLSDVAKDILVHKELDKKNLNDISIENKQSNAYGCKNKKNDDDTNKIENKNEKENEKLDTTQDNTADIVSNKDEDIINTTVNTVEVAVHSSHNDEKDVCTSQNLKINHSTLIEGNCEQNKPLEKTIENCDEVAKNCLKVTLKMLNDEKLTEKYKDKEITTQLNSIISCDKSDDAEVTLITSNKVLSPVNVSKEDPGIQTRDLFEKEVNDNENEHTKLSEINIEDSTQDKTFKTSGQNLKDVLGFKIISAKSLVDKNTGEKALQTEHIASTDVKDTSKAPIDPLDLLKQKTALEKHQTTSENGAVSDETKNNDDEDDDVLLIEHRSSPICIDSDPEDEDSEKKNSSLPTASTKIPASSKNYPLSKPIERKSTTAAMESIRHIIKKHCDRTPRPKNLIRNNQNKARGPGFVKKDPKALMETIDLLNSDSDGEQSKDPKNSNPDEDVIIVSSTQPQRRLLSKNCNQIVPSPKQLPRLYSIGFNKSPTKSGTAQSNFLNAVNLQPTKSNSSNPASFSARLYNKKVIIPNAFYGNPSYNKKACGSSLPQDKTKEDSSSNDSAIVTPTRAVGVHSGVSIRHVQDKVLKEWLEGFLNNFSSPLQVASHACFVLLQRVLKYRFFQRLKETRLFLNQAAKNCSSEGVDVQMLLDLRNVFLENDYLTEAGRRFCRFATNDAFGKPVALTSDAKTGKITCRTRVASKGDLPTNVSEMQKNLLVRSTKPVTSEKSPTLIASPISTSPTTIAQHSTSKTVPSTQIPSTNQTPAPKRKGKFRKLSDGLVVAEKDEDDNDYTPNFNAIEPGADIVTERKRSLRTNRTKRKEAGFTYSEDHDDEEFEALARKIEEKRKKEIMLAEEKELEMEKELLEQQYKTTKNTVAKKTTSKRAGGQFAGNTKGPTRKKLRLANTSIVGSEENDLLTPTWIEADIDDGEADSILDFADEPQSPSRDFTTTLIESDSDDECRFQNDETLEEASQDPVEGFDMNTNRSLKNIDRNLHVHSKTQDFCVHCLKRVPRIVHHYVNEHRTSEIFNSRLRNRDIRRLLTTNNVGFVHLYKGNQMQYAAHCIFCDKEAKFLLPYWFEHFTMHTGEYSFKCSGCHIMKPTRSLLTNHISSNTGCPKKGTAIRLVNFDTKAHQIEAHICSLCNYVQLHRKNLLKHLRTQHGLDTISPEQIIKVVLLQISASHHDQNQSQSDESQLAFLQNSDDDDNSNNVTSLDESSLMMQNDFTDNDDLSFMICGMLDVQTNLSPTG